MGKAARVELVDAVRARYGAASRDNKGKILDEFVAVPGFHRKHAIRVRIGTRWADGVFRSTGRCLEIKGPTDSPRPGQLTDHQKMGGGKFPAVVSCQTCDLNCSKSNPCPSPLKTV